MKERLTVIFDTNIYWQDRDSASVKWTEFRNVHNHYDCAVLLPLVVSHELVGLRIQEIRKKKSELQDIAQKSEKLLNDLNEHYASVGMEKIPSLARGKLLNDLGGRAEENFVQDAMCLKQAKVLQNFVGVEVIAKEFPEISHEDVVKRCSLMLAPFSQQSGKDKGYKDFLFWHSIVSFAKTTEGKVVVVTGDSNFYAKENQLHKDLKKDLTDSRIDLNRLIVCRNLADFIDQYVKPFVESDIEYAHALRHNFLEKMNDILKERTCDFSEILEEFIDQEVELPDSQFVREIHIDTAKIFNLLDVKKYPGGLYLCTSDVVFKCEIYDLNRFFNEEIYPSSFKRFRNRSIEICCEFIVDENNNLKSLLPRPDKKLEINKLVNCRMALTKEQKGWCLSVETTFDFIEKMPMIQHWEIEQLRRLLQEFDVIQNGVIIEGVFEKQVPSVLVQKWGYKLPIRS